MGLLYHLSVASIDSLSQFWLTEPKQFALYVFTFILVALRPSLPDAGAKFYWALFFYISLYGNQWHYFFFFFNPDMTHIANAGGVEHIGF